MEGELEPHCQYVNIHLISLFSVRSWINKPPVFSQKQTPGCAEKVLRSVSVLTMKILCFSLRWPWIGRLRSMRSKKQNKTKQTNKKQIQVHSICSSTFSSRRSSLPAWSRLTHHMISTFQPTGREERETDRQLASFLKASPIPSH